MKTTKNVNIAGVLHVMDEDAYDFLTSYLNDISSRISDPREKSEIIKDVELRIFEIIKEHNISGYRVVSIDLIKHCATIIGAPEIFGEARGEKSYSYSSAQFQRKKLMRDPFDKVIGGLCSGFAVYAGLDTTLVRVAMLLFGIFGGGILVYIICWIIIPEARTPSDIELMKFMKKNNMR